MAEPILLLGKSGTGKSSSLRDLPPAQTIVFRPNSKTFPFGNEGYVIGQNLIITSELDTIRGTIDAISNQAPNVKYVVLEDFTHFFSARIFSDKFLARKNGGEAFQRWTDFAASVFDALFKNIEKWREDMYIIIVHHTEIKDDGTVGFKSAGKLLDNSIDVPSYFNFIFHSVTIDKDEGTDYMFQTNQGAGRLAKSFPGMFELYERNNLAPMLDKIDKVRLGTLNLKASFR